MKTVAKQEKNIRFSCALVRNKMVSYGWKKVVAFVPQKKHRLHKIHACNKMKI